MEITQTRARALIRGTGPWSAVNGLATFRQCRQGVLVTVEVQGLPQNPGPEPWFQVGIQPEQPLSHRWNRRAASGAEDSAPPPRVGELPPLVGCEGMAFASFLTGRFRVEQIIGDTLTIRPRQDESGTGPTNGETVAWGQIVAGC